MNTGTSLLFTVFFACFFFPSQACTQNALGTARVLSLGTQGGFAVGLKTYPQGLTLEDHEVVLTFDDGPWPATTPKILDALAAECVQATFFLIGRNAAAAPSLVKRELAEGHTVGHHSYSHPSVTLRGLSSEAAQADIDRGFVADDMAGYGSAATRPRVPFFRYPGFGDSPALNEWLKTRGVGIFGTDIWASDWSAMSPAAELALVMKRLEVQRRGIILFHDTKAQTAAMLPAFLRELKLRGYKIVHIVPGAGAAETRPAPQGWNSETERTMKRLGM